MHHYIKHDGTNALKVFIDGTVLEDQVEYADGKGQSSIIRAVQEYFG
jgi:hypothetical protein